MSAYTNYYTSADTSVFIENGQTGSSVMIDTLAGIGWMEGLTSGPVSGLGESRFGFINSGNVLTNGMIQLNFTHQNYLQCILEYVMISQIEPGLSVEEAFNSLSLEYLQEDIRNRKALAIAKESKQGIQSFPQGFNIRVVFNNGNLYHDDINRTFLLKQCKIVASGMSPTVADDGQLI